MKFYIYTFGCKTNTYESEAMSTLLASTGRFEEAPDHRDAEVVIVNSCMVTEESEKKARKLLRRIRRENRGACIVLCGCMSQVNGEKCLETGADVVCGNKDRAGIVNLIDSFFSQKSKGNGDPRIVKVEPHLKGDEIELLAPLGYKKLTRANLKIEDGCDCYCTYCVIPYARGHVRSLPVEKVSEFTKNLVAGGHREIVLTGINIGMYGRDSGLTVFDAVKAAAEAGAERIRLGSLEIDLIEDETIKKLSEIPELCPHFHTSLQSGSERILKRMGRRYTPEEYMRKIGLLRQYFPNASVTTDVIVGFPGETEKDFEDTVAFVKEAGFFRIHVFPYSRRKGTKAAEFPDQVPTEVKKRRAAELEKTAALLKNDFLKTQIGKTLNVLFERSSGGFARGHGDNYVEVRVRTDEDLKNRILPVTISDVDVVPELLIGSIR